MVIRGRLVDRLLLWPAVPWRCTELWVAGARSGIYGMVGRRVIAWCAVDRRGGGVVHGSRCAGVAGICRVAVVVRIARIAGIASVIGVPVVVGIASIVRIGRVAGVAVVVRIAVITAVVCGTVVIIVIAIECRVAAVGVRCTGIGV